MDSSAQEGRFRDNNGMPPCAEMAKWLHMMTDTMIHRPGNSTNAGTGTLMRREISNRWEPNNMKALTPGSAPETASMPKTFEDSAAAMIRAGERLLQTVFVGDVESDTFGASPQTG